MNEYKDTRQLLSEAKFFESYSRYNESLKRYESWEEAVSRVMGMHRKYFKSTLETAPSLKEYIDKVETAYKEKRILGAQRSLQFGGDQLLSHNMRIYNCTSSHLDRAKFFGEYFYILLCGCGAGYSVQKHHVSKLPMIRPRTKQAKIHTIEDSIEGWATAADVLLSSFFIGGGGVHPEYEGRRVHFEYHKIRDRGAPISGGFKAPGPEPLRKCLEKIETLLVNIAEEGILRPIHVYDICCYLADAVLSGGVRRAATICLFSKDDQEMLNAKTGDWLLKNPQRARSNNSVVLKRDEIEFAEFNGFMDLVKQYGEPGFVFVTSYEHCFNPCITADTWIDTKEGLKQVKSLIDTPFVAIVDGKEYDSKKGFWKTGNKEVFEVETFRGYKIKATSNHKVLVEKNKERLWVEVKDLMIGDMMIINENLNTVIEIDEKEKSIGWLLGEVVGDGCHNPEKYSSLVRFWGDDGKRMATIASNLLEENFPSKYTGRNAKPVYDNFHKTYTVSNKPFTNFCAQYLVPGTKDLIDCSIEKMSLSFMAGFISGLFDADGTINWSCNKNSRSIRLTQNNLKRLETIQIMLAKLGIASTIYKDRSKNRDTWEEYDTKPVHDLHISRNCMDKFAELVGFYDLEKSKKLKEMLQSRVKTPYRDRYISEITSINSVGTEEVYDCTVEDIHCFSANGLIVHNCVEIGMYPKTKDGVSGWQGCNLVEINGALCTSEKEFYESCASASALATLQAAYTDFKFVGSETKEIFEREALLGVSVTGWMNAPDILFDKKIMQKGAKIVRETNEKVAVLLGINPAARTTCVKPAGNASVLLGTASGIHPEHSRRYIRNIQINKMEEVGAVLKTTNPYMVEESVWGDSDYVISFPIIPPTQSAIKADLSGVEFLNKVKEAQTNWVEYGTNEELCVDKTVRHNVSNTVTVRANEWEEVAQYLYDNRQYFTGVSLIAETGDKDYYQAPFIEVLSPEELASKYGPAAFFASGLIVDAPKGFQNLWEAALVVYNEDDAASQEQKDIRADWIRRFKKFAVTYFNSDLKRAEYCLKDVYILYKWMKIQTNFMDIDLISQLHSMKTTDIDTMGASSCYAGACTLR